MKIIACTHVHVQPWSEANIVVKKRVISARLIDARLSVPRMRGADDARIRAVDKIRIDRIDTRVSHPPFICCVWMISVFLIPSGLPFSRW